MRFSDRYLRTTTYSRSLLCAYWKWYVGLKSMKTHRSTLYTFIHTICQKNGTICVILQYGNLQGIILHN